MQDHSDLMRAGWPAYGASQAAGGTIDNDIPWGKLPGSESEQTDLASQGVSVKSDATPNLDFKPGGSDRDTASPERTKSRFSNSYSPPAPEWKTVK